MKNSLASERREGREDEVVDSIVSFLEDCGEPTETLRIFLKKQELVKLRAWNKLAARVKSVEEFEEKIGFRQAVGNSMSVSDNLGETLEELQRGLNRKLNDTE